jgi:DNA-binding transcriptional LysR family regulator
LEERITALASGIAGRLSLGSFPTASERLIPYALSTYVRSHPDVEVHLDEGEPRELLGMIESHEVDIAVVYDYDMLAAQPPPGVTIHTLFTEDMFLLVRDDHPLAGETSVSMGRLGDEEWVATRPDSVTSSVLLRLAAIGGFHPVIRFRSNDYAVVRELVLAGFGVAMLPALGNESEPGLSAIRIDHPQAKRTVTAVVSHATPQAIEEDFITVLLQSATVLSRATPGITVTHAKRTTPPASTTTSR